VRSGPRKKQPKTKKKKKTKYSGQQQNEIDSDEPHLGPKEKNAAYPANRTASWCIGGCWFSLALHPIHEIPERDFLDGALVGARSLRPVLGHSSRWN